jgi:energy-coupling factor transport system permease protein
MKSFEDFNPIAIFIYFAAVPAVPMFCANPALAALSLCGAAALFMLRGGARPRDAVIYGLLFVIMAAINPIFYHNGMTVLFVANDNPVTLEATVYGIVASAVIVSVLLWFRSFSRIMTSDRLLYLFGRVSPKLALLLSMALRYIPLFGAQAKRVNDAQKALGLYKDDNIVDDIRGGTRVFSVMVSWALENGIITADSMTARGYGIGRRSFFAIYRFTRVDAALLLVTLAFFAVAAAGVATDAVTFAYYPAIIPPENRAAEIVVYAAYALLAFIPALIEAEESVKWKYLQSKI